MIRPSLVFVLLASLPLPVAAGELIPPNAIASVTVFAEGAQIVRRVPVVLPAGSTTVVVGDLPADLDADSLEIDGSADQPLAITSVETRVAPADSDKLTGLHDGNSFSFHWAACLRDYYRNLTGRGLGHRVKSWKLFSRRGL